MHEDAFQKFRKALDELIAFRKHQVIAKVDRNDGSVMSSNKEKGFYFSLNDYRMTIMLYRNRSEPARTFELIYTENIWAWVETEELMTGDELAQHLFKEAGLGG
ncbi:MAG TPA: hypothetical protein V6C86_21140 [Oculatellaceae cyanobacterium]